MESLSVTDITDEKKHHVTLTLSIVQAVESTTKEYVYHESFRDGERKRIYESPTPDHFFHIEYKILPGKNAQVFKTDIITFGDVVSKVYTDKDNRVVQCWSEEVEGDRSSSLLKQNYFGWRHKHSFSVNKTQLLELYDHVIEVRIWNSKSKVSPKAKYDRPKAFRVSIRDSLTQHKGGETTVDFSDTPGITKRPSKFAIVSHDSMRMKAGNRRPSKVINLPVPTIVSNVTVESSNERVETEQSAESVSVSPRSVNQDMQAEEQGVASEHSKLVMDIKVTSDDQLAPIESVLQSSSVESALSPESSKQQLAMEVLSRRKQRKLEAEMAKQAIIERDGIAVVRLNVLNLFGKSGCTCSRLESPIKTLKHFEVCVSVGDSFLSDELAKELKPMVITVVKATGLPYTPVSHETLQERCDPVYAKYQFHTKSPHCTTGIPQASQAVWNDTHIILLGTIDHQLLVEYLRGPPLVVEVHDRSLRQVNELKPALFGEETKDDVLGTHAFTTGMSHTTNAIHGGGKVWSPYGIAKFDLSGLLHGHRVLEMVTPVIGGPRCLSDLQNLESTENYPTHLPPGDYLESHCELKVIVEVIKPMCLINASTTLAPSIITSPSKIQQFVRRGSRVPYTPNHRKGIKDFQTSQLGKVDESTPLSINTCPFNRLVYIISSEGVTLVQKLIHQVNQINSRSLMLDKLSDKILLAALSTYKLTKEQVTSSECNVITGFHLDDWKQHVIVLEGLKTGGLKIIWDSLPHHPMEDEKILKVFYNSEFEFSQRLYASLDVDLPKIKLYQPLSVLTHHSLIFIKDSVPLKCFRALMALSELNHVNEMADVSRNNLLPTAEEISALSLQFSMHMVDKPGDKGSNGDASMEHPQTLALLQQCNRKYEREPLELTNLQFERYLKERSQKPAVNYIATNMQHTMALSELSASLKPSRSHRQRSHSETSDTSVHNYSTQTFNSIKLAKAKLQERLSVDPTHRYTFCKDYHSMTVVPIDVEAEQRAQRLDARHRWLTKEGFVLCGVASASSKKLDPGRVDYLKEPFEDNLLHANTLKPSVDRLHFDWKSRSLDFEKWKKPPGNCDLSLPTSIHMAGESREKELRENLDKHKQEWKNKPTAFQHYRRGTRTELGNGPALSTQLEKLQGLLKDPPQKHSLKQNVLSIPALYVLHDPRLDSRLNMDNVNTADCQQDGCMQGYLPGPNEKRSLKLDSNVIPLTRP